MAKKKKQIHHNVYIGGTLVATKKLRIYVGSREKRPKSKLFYYMTTITYFKNNKKHKITKNIKARNLGTLERKIRREYG